MKEERITEIFDFNGIKLQHKEQHNDFCSGCYFWENDILCNKSNVPACNTGIYVEVEEE